MMRPPCEIIAQNLLPLIRGYVAFELAQKMTQQDVAERMGVSQPTVSSYLKSFSVLKEKSEEEYLENASVKKLVSHISSMIETNQPAEKIIHSICSTCVSLRIGGLTCRKHLASYSGISQGCTGCLPITDKGVIDIRQKVLSQLDEAVFELENNPFFGKLIPQVMSNICLSIPNPQTIDDVAAIPGRITKVRGRVRALLPPEFGVSDHMAKILLTLNSINPIIVSIICILYNERVLKAITNLNLVQISLDNEQFKQFLNTKKIADIKKLEQILPSEVGILIHQGGLGIEPIVYLFSQNIQNLVSICSEIAKQI
ncbi:MAG: helix-turn-helix domain-containing protein [Candidatus Heimdallarchaeota archaeon]|nr:helix-turn-helix domain-containing protein [Candidatus Heimdallarchaeota archaeon]